MKSPVTRSRREVLETFFASLIATAFSPLMAFALEDQKNKRLGSLQGGFHRMPQGFAATRPYDSAQFTHKRAFRISFDQMSMVELESQTPIHSAEAHPLDRNLALAVPRSSNVASLVDWRAGKEVRTLKLPPDTYYWGHAAFSATGKYAVLPSYTTRSREVGSLLILDVEKFSIVQQMAIPKYTHDVVRIAGNRFVIGTSSDPENRIRLIEFDLDSLSQKTHYGAKSAHPRQLGHIIKTAGSRVLVTCYRTVDDAIKEAGLVEFNFANGEQREVVHLGQSGFFGEPLSLDVTPESSRIWVTVPDYNRVLVWNTKDNRLEKTIHLPTPRSISTLADQGLVAIGTPQGFSVFDAQTLGPVLDLNRKLPFTHRDGRKCSHTRLIT